MIDKTGHPLDNSGEQTDASLVPARIAHHAHHRPNRVAFRHVPRAGSVAGELTWGELWAGACANAAALSARNLAGQRIAIACDKPLDFVVALCACLISGSPAVPTPAILSRRSLPRMKSIIERALPRAVFVSAGTEFGDLPPATSDDPPVILPVTNAGQSDTAPPDGGDSTQLALIQFSSGSTGSPKGIGLSHDNLAANCAAIAQAFDLSPATRGLSWLPLHHDMGLVGHILVPLWLGCRSTLSDPLRFLQRPLSWLRMVESERATITSAPNFAYELCVREAGRSSVGDLDLSSLTTSVCGGEPVLATTMRGFLETFGPCGFLPAAMAPSYGLAEATLLVASGKSADGPKFTVPDDIGLTGSIRREAPVIALGKPVRGMGVRIVDTQGRDVEEGVLGEVVIAGSSLGTLISGDGDMAEITSLATGDYGFLHAGDLYLTGRKKDLIIIRGQNIHPADLEAAILACDAAVRPGGVAALGLSHDGTEKLVLIAEVDHRRGKSMIDLANLKSKVSAVAAEACGVVASDVVLTSVGTLPRTSSGKVQHARAARMYRSGAIEPLVARPRRQEAMDVEP